LDWSFDVGDLTWGIGCFGYDDGNNFIDVDIWEISPYFKLDGSERVKLFDPGYLRFMAILIALLKSFCIFKVFLLSSSTSLSTTALY
jgi:hypothetical protein